MNDEQAYAALQRFYDWGRLRTDVFGARYQPALLAEARQRDSLMPLGEYLERQARDALVVLDLIESVCQCAHLESEHHGPEWAEGQGSTACSMLAEGCVCEAFESATR